MVIVINIKTNYLLTNPSHILYINDVSIRGSLKVKMSQYEYTTASLASFTPIYSKQSAKKHHIGHNHN